MTVQKGSPLGLPDGSIRGLLAVAFGATIIQQVVVGAIDPITFIGIAGPFLGYYVAQRGAEDTAKAVATATVSEVLPAPSVPEDDAKLSD